jgi:hypothetical protein
VSEPLLIDQPEHSRYVLELDGRRVGLLDYRLDRERIALIHTEIDPSFEGRGLGSALVRFALDDARVRGLAVLPQCPFVPHFIRLHPEYRELVPEGERARYRV